MIPAHIRGTAAFESIKLAPNKCVLVCSSSFQYIIQCLVSGMGAIIREQGSSFISYWTLLISEALIKHGADICHGWEAYEEPFVKAQRSFTMSSAVHLSRLPLRLFGRVVWVKLFCCSLWKEMNPRSESETRSVFNQAAPLSAITLWPWCSY